MNPSATTPEAERAAIEHRLDRIEARLDTLIDRGEATRDLLTEAGPILQSMSRAATARFGELEERGYFGFGRQLLRALDRVVAAYGEADLAAFADAAVHITETVRQLTQPEVLDAIDAAGHAAGQGGEPLSMWGAMKATRDPEVQRGLAIVFAVLRGLGRGAPDAPSAAPPMPRPTGGVQPTPPVSAGPRAVAPSAAPSAAPATPAAPGGRFDPDGFLRDPSIWTAALGGELAAHLGVELTEHHWTAINWARADWQATGASPNVRRIADGSTLGIRGLYTLFPRQPGKTIARIAGIPKPVGCL